MVLEGEAQLVSASLLDWPMMVPPSHLPAHCPADRHFRDGHCLLPQM